MQEAFDTVVQECVQAFAEEMIESIAVTQTGVATTSAFAPFIPELVIAEKLLQVINDAL